jgi:hypothetical protein
MLSIALPPSTVFSTKLGRPELGPDSERPALNLGRSTSARGYSPRALPPPRSMSSSDPARDALETSGEARRPRRPELSQIVTTTTEAFGPALFSAPPPTAEAELSLQRAVPTSGSELQQRPFVHDPLRPRLPPVFSGQSATQSAESTFSTAPLTTSPTGETTRPLTHKPTRRTKAHVASACVNCKKKHLGCDSARPCRRCVLAGKAVGTIILSIPKEMLTQTGQATCVDITHKKRGRPPLKAEQASLRPYAATLENPTSSIVPPQQSQLRRPSMHRATSSRELRPSTDLQFPGGGAGGFEMVTSSEQPQRWGTSILPRAMNPPLPMPGAFGQRRFSVSDSPQQVAPRFVPMTAGFNPTLEPGRLPLSHGSPKLPTVTSPPQYHPPLGLSIPPSFDSPRTMNRPHIGHILTTDNRGPTSPESPVRLPPIFSTSATTGPAGHRLSDPYPTPWVRRPQELARRPSQGEIGLLSPRTEFRPTDQQFRPTGPTVSYTEPLVSQHRPITSAHEHPMSLPRTRPGEGHAGTEEESGEARPTKRRKMALDDMVND